MVYVLLFPQLLLVIHAESRCNKYGCITSFLAGLVLRILSKYNWIQCIIIKLSVKYSTCLLGGEELLGLPAVLQLPLYSDGQQQFPFRTAIMVLTLVVHLSISYVTEQCFTRGWLAPKYDLLHCYHSPLEMTYQPDASSEELRLQLMANGKQQPFSL